MNYWMCDECKYIFKVEIPPKNCPGCNKECAFSNVSCYIPECGGEGNFDPKLVAQVAEKAKK